MAISGKFKLDEASSFIAAACSTAPLRAVSGAVRVESERERGGERDLRFIANTHTHFSE